MRDFFEAIFGFTEEKGGLLSAIGVGKPSALSRPFKIVARSLAAVASSLTFPPRKSAGKSPANFTLDTRNAYDAMKSRKEYAPYTEVWSLVDAVLTARPESLTFNRVRHLLIDLVALLFKQHTYLLTLVELR